MNLSIGTLVSIRTSKPQNPTTGVIESLVIRNIDKRPNKKNLRLFANIKFDDPDWGKPITHNEKNMMIDISQLDELIVN